MTHYYYKDDIDPDDPSVNLPISIDTIFMTKRRLDVEAPAEDKVGLVELGRDTSDLFEKADEGHGLPPAMLYGGEPTYYYVPDNDNVFKPKYVIRSVNGTINQGKRVKIWGGGSANRTFEVPEEYKDRYIYWLFSTYMSSGRGTTNTALRAGIMGPGTDILEIGNPTTYTIDTHMEHRLYFFECDVDADVPEDPPGLTDIANIYAGNKYTTEWWLPMLYFKNIPNQTANRYSTVTITGLPRIPFKAALQQVEWDDEWRTPGYYHHGKGFYLTSAWDVTTWTVTRAHGGRAYTYAFGVEMSTGV